MVNKQVFSSFASFQGSEHIASEHALRGIERLIHLHSIRSVFEFGIGIGTIPYLVKKIDPTITYTGIEDNAFCIDALHQHLEPFINSPGFTHIRSTSELVAGERFDLIIIDGQFNDPQFLKQIVHPKSILMVEGNRAEQTKIIRSLFHDSLVSRVITNRKNYSWSPFDSNHYMGGYTLLRLNHASIFNQSVWMIEKILTALNYRFRQLQTA